MRLILDRLRLATALLFVGFPAIAHHSSAIYDSEHVTVEGVVTAFHWESPHVYIDVTTAQEGGENVTWSIEADSPQLLTRAGWSSSSLAPGDRVVVIAAPARDPHRRAALVNSVLKADGTLLGTSHDPSGFAAAVRLITPQPSCPRVDLTLVEPSASSETRPVKLGDEAIFVRRSAITTTSDISEIKVAGDDVLRSIQIKYNPTAAARLLDATTNRDGQRMAFVVDDDVWLAFTWEGPYGTGGTQLTIRNGMARAQGLVESILACTGE